MSLEVNLYSALLNPYAQISKLIAIPDIPVINNGRLPSLSMAYIATRVNKTVVRLKNIPEKKDASVPIPVCLNIDVA